MSRLRNAAKGFAKGAAARLARPATGSDRRVVLLYHSVHASVPYASASPQGFADQLDWLLDTCNVVSTGELMGDSAPSAEGGGDRPLVALTFDDGYVDNHEHALPALKDRGLSAEFFITTGFIDDEPMVLERFRRVQRSDDVASMNWQQVEELRDEGMQIGAHTITHANLRVTAGGTTESEIVDSRRRLEDRLQIEVSSFAFPFGKPKSHYESSTVDLVRAAGFQTCYSTLYRGLRDSDDPLEIPRISVSGENLEQFQSKLFGTSDVIGWWQATAPRWLGDRVSPETAQSGESASIPG